MTDSPNLEDLDFSRIHFSLAGSGDPWGSLTRLRVKLMKGLSYEATPRLLAEHFKMSLDDVMIELQPLRDVSLVKEYNGTLRPSFLMTDESETIRVYDHARDFSKSL